MREQGERRESLSKFSLQISQAEMRKVHVVSILLGLGPYNGS